MQPHWVKVEVVVWPGTKMFTYVQGPEDRVLIKTVPRLLTVPISNTSKGRLWAVHWGEGDGERDAGGMGGCI